MVNKVLLRGFVGKNPEMYNGVAKFSMATEDSYKDDKGNWNKKTEWHNIVAFGKTAERVMEKVRKGDYLAIDDGKLSHREYENKQGQKVHTTSVQIMNFEVLKKNDKYANQEKDQLDQALERDPPERFDGREEIPF